jgi:hypothetical protein
MPSPHSQAFHALVVAREKTMEDQGPDPMAVRTGVELQTMVNAVKLTI